MQNPEQDVKQLPLDATGNVELFGETTCYIAGGVVVFIAAGLTLNIFYNTAALLQFFQCVLFFCTATAMVVLVWYFRRHVKHALAALAWLIISCVIYGLIGHWMGV